MSFRPSPGYYTAFLEFEDETPATVVKDGYGYFLTTELVPSAGPSKVSERTIQLRKALRVGKARDEGAQKERLRFGGGREDESLAATETGARTGFQQDAGLVVVSCEQGPIRQSPSGLYVYDDDGQHEVEVEELRHERMAELDEMYHAITENRPVRHHGRWGIATLEVILAMLESSRTGKGVRLSHRVPAWE